jgi:transcription elongation factor GreA
MNKQYRLTKEGIAELEAELKSLIARRTDVADAIKTAREQGDLSENAEYQSARTEQERLEARVSEIEHILANSDVINKPKGDSKVQLGSTVKLKGSNGKEQTFQVVGTVEADPLNGKISDESPIGKALLGKNLGDIVEVAANSDIEYKISKID